MMADILPPQACAIVVPAATDAAPTCLIGLMVHGDEPSLIAFEAEMLKLGIRGGRIHDAPEPEVSAIFAGASRSAAFSLVATAMSGRLGDLKVEVVVAPADKAQDGLDLQTEVTAESPAILKWPSK